MSTTKMQRVGIWIIAAFMAIGTIGSFAIIILGNKNNETDQKKINELAAAYQQQQTEYQNKVDAQTKELSDQHFATLNQFSARVGSFTASSVTDLKTEDLLVGSGDTLTDKSTFGAYYIGWNPSGTIFDSSIANGALKAPLTVAPGSVIEGWTKGVIGMKLGGVRELIIPASLAYGETGSGDNIPPNTPLKFIILAIPTPATFTQPEMPAQLLKYYQTGRLS